MKLAKNFFMSNNILLFVALLMLITPLAYSADQTRNNAQTSVSIADPFARSTPPGQKVAGSFMRLINNTAENIDLIAANSPIANVTELHETRMKDGVMRMIHVGKMTIPANGSTTLKPGGLHIMLIDLKKQLMPGETIQITLEFSDQSHQTIDVPVVKMAGMKHHHHH